MVIVNKEWAYEQSRLEEIYGKIQDELAKRSKEIKSCRKEIISSRKSMSENVHGSPGQFEEMVQAQQYIDEIKREYEKYTYAHGLMERLEKTALSPYFARVDFKEDGAEDADRIYIGALSFIDTDTRKIYIYDWRAPISSIFYDYETGPAKYSCLEGEIRGYVTLKRQFKIFKNCIDYMFDSSLKIDDEILQKILSKNTDDKMRNIIATIQREQNRIIRNEDNNILVVQGAAGSGKTSIALHRAAYLLYRYRDSISSKNILIFSPNQIFNDYISNVLPEMGEENISQTTFWEFAKSIIGASYRIEDLSGQLEFLSESGGEAEHGARKHGIEFKASREFFGILKNYLSYIEKHIKFEDIRYQGQPVISREDLVRLLNRDYKHLPLIKRLAKIRERIYFILAIMQKDELKKTQIQLEDEGDFKGEIKAASRMIVSKSLKPLRDRIEAMTTLDVFNLYYELFDDGKLLTLISDGIRVHDGIDGIRRYTLKALDRRIIKHEDIAPLLYMKGVLEGVPNVSQTKHVIIDEAQDYSYIHYEVFKQYFGNCSITVLGDSNQTFYLRADNYCDSISGVFEVPGLLLLHLTKSYRSTREIVEFTRAMLENPAEIEPINRNGEKPKITGAEGESELIRLIAGDISSLTAGDAKSIGVICKTAAESKRVYDILKQSLDAGLISRDDEEFKKGTVVIPVYLSKGLEFDAVLVFNAGEENYSTGNDARLLYVACTRALHKLHIYYKGTLTHFISGLDKHLYEM